MLQCLHDMESVTESIAPHEGYLHGFYRLRSVFEI